MRSFSTCSGISLLSASLLLSRLSNAQELTEWNGWEDLVESIAPNATGRATFQGYNITAPYRSNATREFGWNVTVEVYSDIPWFDRYDDEEEADDAGVDDTMFGTGTLIKLAAPEDLPTSDDGTVEADKSWFSCVNIWSIPLWEQVVESDDKVNGDGDDCERVMKSDCWDWVKQVNENGELCEQDKALDVPEACHGAAFYTYIDRVPRGEYVLADFLHDGGTTTTRQTHQKGNHTAYDRALRGIWIGMFGFAESRGGDGLEFYPKNDTGIVGDVVCLRASNITEGSRSVEAGEEDVQEYLDARDGAPGLHVAIWTVLGAAGMTAGLLV